MSVNRCARSGDITGKYFLFSLTGRYVVCSHDEAILISTHNILFSMKNHPKSAAMGVIPRTKRTSSKQPW